MLTVMPYLFPALVKAQTVPPVSQTTGAVSANAGGVLRGTIKSGNVPLPGVAVTATNTLTGKRFATTTDITGAWSMTIPQNGRYVVRTEFAAFAPATHEALLNAASHEAVLNFDLLLASRAAQQTAREDQQAQAQQVTQAIRQLTGSGAESLNLINSLAAGTDAAEGGTTATGAALPSAAESTSAGSDSVAVNGQSGQVSPLAGLDPDRIRDAIETMRSQGGGGFFGGPGFGGPGGFGGGPGGFGGFGGRGNFRGFRPDQPHGAIYWNGNNSALNAEPFSLRGQESTQPNYGSNQFGITLMGEPFIPKLVKPSGKDTVFLNISGTRSSTPFDQYAVVPTQAQRGSCSNTLTSSQSAACNLLTFFPLPNLTNNESYNYYFASTAQSNSTQAGFRYMRAFGPNASLPSGGGRGGGRRGNSNQGLRQSVNANVNWSDSASDNVNIFPELGGKTASHNYSVQTGYSLGYKRINDNLTAGWNRAVSQATNFFTNGTDIATQIGVLGPSGTALNASPLNYGVPNIVLSGTTGLSEQQPSFRIQQTISVSDVFSVRHGKHNYRFGGDYRRVHQDVLGSSNATGTFNFTGDTPDDAIDALLNDQPTSSTIQSAIAKDYLRQNTWDVYALDDFRALSYLTLNYGVRYEYFSPVSEKFNHLSEIAANPDFTQITEIYPGCTGLYCGSLPSTLVYPFRTGFAPRVAIALRLPKSTVLRASYGINFTNSQFASFATSMAHQPPFANVQTNTTIPITLENGFPVPESEQAPNYAVSPHYTLPYIQVWNIDVQKTLPWGIVINAGYNGSKGTHLDDKIAPYPVTQTSSFAQNPLPFQYEFSSAFSNFNNATLRVRKRLERGVSLGAYYQYSHSIDDAGALGGASTVVAQNWQNIVEDEGNSSIDQRHRLTGDYLIELPFGKDKAFLTGGGFASRALEGLSISGSFTFATGTPLNPTFQATGSELLTNTAGSERPNRTPGISFTTGGGSQLRWFNTAAFSTSPPANGIGNASRNSIPGPGTVSNNMSFSKTEQLGDTRSLEVRATANNVFNTVQFSGVDTNVQSPTFGQVSTTTGMRSFQFLARFRF
ncbi:TonB-dependent receptor domain-containing protein [Acidicapsa dinghuensis]|uniref:TonB-dependent receptor domain-containing protein n=1 Tax=Acidicapsa dinghuensis TaxID=2218256 RepID=A0ABW1EEB3_9BACT|nr:TonB-dependent receptor [Acidicapsa dinghuensis]